MPRLSFSGFDRSTETQIRAVFEDLHLPDWSLSDEAVADAVLIDLDSVYGQMAWMKGINPEQLSIGLSRALRAGTTFLLPAPLQAEALAAVLREAAEALSVAVPSISTPSLLVDTTRETAATSIAPSAARLAARIARAQGAFTVEHADLPRLTIDPQRQQFAPGKSLKALLGYATAELPAEACTTLNADAAAAALKQAGDPQPLGRLTWLLVLGGGEGRLQNHGPATRFQLGRWPPVEREFPKHFRIATVMLRAPATIAEIALSAGSTEADVADYINAALAAGHATAT